MGEFTVDISDKLDGQAYKDWHTLEKVEKGEVRLVLLYTAH